MSKWYYIYIYAYSGNLIWTPDLYFNLFLVRLQLKQRPYKWKFWFVAPRSVWEIWGRCSQLLLTWHHSFACAPSQSKRSNRKVSSDPYNWSCITCLLWCSVLIIIDRYCLPNNAPNIEGWGKTVQCFIFFKIFPFILFLFYMVKKGNCCPLHGNFFKDKQQTIVFFFVVSKPEREEYVRFEDQ